MRTNRRTSSPLAAIRRFVQPRAAHAGCELCSAALLEEHEHLLEGATRRILCACTPCAILFGHRGDLKYRRIPRRIENLPDLRLTDLQWEGFGLPVALAFLFPSTTAGRVVAVYPSPAGATESVLPVDTWDEFLAENPALGDLEPDVEALLVNRVGPARQHFRVGIDHCYRLAGLVRMHWRGFTGGDELWSEIGRFFADLRQRSGLGGERSDA